MNKISISFIHDGIQCTGSADEFTQDDIWAIKDAYFSWKSLNKIYTNYNMRRANFPELISEGLTSAVFGYKRTNATAITGLKSSSMDLVDLTTGETIQLKACSTDKEHAPGPTSFGPESEFDILLFMHMDCETDTVKWYKLDAKDYKNWKVNRTETIADQQKQGRRPRLTILNKIKENHLTPIMTVQFTPQEVIINDTTYRAICGNRISGTSSQRS